MTDWENSETLLKWREDWANTVNKEFDRLGIDERIDHRTLEAQGIDRTPTKHMGHDAWNLEKKGRKTKIGDDNREIYRKNAERTPENYAEYMRELKEKHLLLHKETSEIKTQTSQLQREIQVLNVTMEEITERAEHIQDIKEHLEELKDQRREMGFFISKKDIDRQMQQLERAHEQATAYFERKYGITPDESMEKVIQLEQESKSKQHICERLQERIKPLNSQQEAVLLEYQRQKLLADISHDREKIYNRLGELEKQNRPHKQSAQYSIFMAENDRILDSISKHNFDIILKDLSPEKQKALTELWENEKEKIRTFEHKR